MPKVGQVTRQPVEQPEQEAVGFRLEQGSVEGLAVHIYDLERLDQQARQALFGGKLDLTRGVRMSQDKADDVGIVFKCPLLEAACLLDVLRSEDRKLGQPETRCWVRRKGWTRLPATAVLTLTGDGELRLNPEWFPSAPVMAKPMQARKVF